MDKILNFIGGEFVPPRGGAFLENIEPARGKAFSLVADSQAQDAAEAIAAAQAAFPAWSRTTVAERSRLLSRLADLIEANLEELARAESRDSGKPISLARRLEIPRSAANFRFFAHAITQFHGETYASDRLALNYTESSPLGVVVCISPWNLPLYLLTWKIAPALAAGNTVVAKPSEVTPLTAFLLGRLVREAGFPPGVLNIVQGLGSKLGDALTTSPQVKAVSFTGSTATGRHIAQATAGSFKKISLEMGGKNANVIFADAPFEEALETAVRSSFQNQGQICLCGSRIFVEKPIYEKFKTGLIERVRALRIGDPLDEKTEQGALVSKPHWEKVNAAVQAANADGGRILCGGQAPSLGGEFSQGYFFAPTLIEGLSADNRANQEEIFGPVATLIPFSSEDEALQMVNSTRYGLAGSVWTKDIHRGHRFARSMDSGLVWVNTWMQRDLRTPFGGVKESGVGREGGLDALRFFTEVKNICIALQDGGPR